MIEILKFIFRDTWTYLGFLLLLLIITRELQRFITLAWGFTVNFFTNVKRKAKAIEQKEKAKQFYQKKQNDKQN